MIHGDSVEVSEASLLKGFCMIEHLPSVPHCFARFPVSSPGANLGKDPTGFVLAFAPSEQLDVVQGYM
jgi:hypothetical protein